MIRRDAIHRVSTIRYAIAEIPRNQINGVIANAQIRYAIAEIPPIM